MVGKLRLVRAQRSIVAVTAVCVVAASGCSSVGDRERAADTVTLDFLQAVAAHDGGTACGLLAPDTAAKVAQSGDTSCAEAILDDRLAAPGALTGTDVYGQWARVRLVTDTVFLAMFPGGWRIVAAGCTPRPDRPYDCSVQGG